jgi:dienelactone hydrolase
MRRYVALCLSFLVAAWCWQPICAGAESAADWVSRFAFEPPVASAEAPAPPAGGVLPAFTVTPAAPGPQLVRVSLPFAPGTVPRAAGLMVSAGGQDIVPDVRVLTRHPGASGDVRRALLTFPHTFDSNEVSFTLRTEGSAAEFVPQRREGPCSTQLGETSLLLDEHGLTVSKEGATLWQARLRAPARASQDSPVTEIIEQGKHYLWARVFVYDTRWPRVLELRADALGTVAVRAHLQRVADQDGYAPELGWDLTGPAMTALESQDHSAPLDTEEVRHEFASGAAARLDGPAGWVAFPDAHLFKRGELATQNTEGSCRIAYTRCKADDHVPHQPYAWRTACFVVGKPGVGPWNALLEPGHTVRIAPASFEPLYACGADPDLSGLPWLDEVRRFHREAMASSSLLGDDFGNVTGMPNSGAFGMNRLNHCPAILAEHYRSGDARLREVAVAWCNNFHDLSIWWGTDRPGEFGGTRYNNAAASGSKEHAGDTAYMWRSNTAVHFCTKGYDTFLPAYEETGDPRLAAALRWQVEYAGRMVHTDQGECRNIGDVLDFVRLYEFTGRSEYLEHALRLFRELRTKLSPGDLFSQGGQPIVDNPPFIDEDDKGYKYPFAKPYIIGYALQGLPALARHAPEEPKLREVIRAVTDFMCGAQDPLGGWRYPHPRSTRMLLDQAMEHAMQLSRAAAWLETRGEPIEAALDAIERTLQARVNGYARTGAFLSGLNAWEIATGKLAPGQNMYDLYQTFDQRDYTRDYAEGAVGVGGSCPEGAVYFTEVLTFYLEHRPAERLLERSPELQQVLDRAPARPTASGEAEEGGTAAYLPYGVADGLPTFRDAQERRLTFPLAYDPQSGAPFDAWRGTARQKLFECLLTPPLAPQDFAPAILAVDDRSSYEARKLALNISADSRIPAYLLVPKGPGPFPAIIALHDHGAHFSIGREKVIRPFGVERKVMEDAEDWVKECYGGRFIGDELAARGYVVMAIDALYWGERGRKEGVSYEAQQQLAANLFQLGMSWLGVITWDDIRSAEFLASLPEVDPARIGAVGLSMGSHRTWMLCAASDRVKAGAAICWMGDTKTLTAAGNNQTTGYSAYSMLAPGLVNYLDYPDVAAIACPKPMLFYNSEKDGLFPIPGVKAAYARMRRVWDSQHAGEKLVTRIWPVAHEFNTDMQREAFAWLDTILRTP